MARSPAILLHLSRKGPWPEQITDVYDIIQDWADTNSADHMSYDQAVALVSSKGHTIETLNACLEEYRSLEFLMLHEETIYFMDS